MPAGAVATLTWDQGKERAEHHRLHTETEVPICFCDPKSPWQRGTNENTNGLLRQYFPKRIANFHDYSQHDDDQVATELNDTPRKILGYQTPSEAVAAIASRTSQRSAI